MIWYATYGSNIYARRLRLYLQGGCIEGLTCVHEGSRNTALPIKDEFIELPYATYFSQQVPFWENRGVAFMNAQQGSGTTLSRMYLITKDQFVDVFAQENGQSPKAFQEEIPFDLTPGTSKDIGSEHSYEWYGKVVCLGEKEGFPIYTFTTKNESFAQAKSLPGINYLAVIIRGLLDAEKDVLEIRDYILRMSPLSESEHELIERSFEKAANLE